MIVTVAVILLLVKFFYKPSQGKREQRAFVKAAKRSKKGKDNRGNKNEIEVHSKAKFCYFLQKNEIP